MNPWLLPAFLIAAAAFALYSGVNPVMVLVAAFGVGFLYLMDRNS